jgi:hypothetical protein
MIIIDLVYSIEELLIEGETWFRDEEKWIMNRDTMHWDWGRVISGTCLDLSDSDCGLSGDQVVP